MVVVVVWWWCGGGGGSHNVAIEVITILYSHSDQFNMKTITNQTNKKQKQTDVPFKLLPDAGKYSVWPCDCWACFVTSLFVSMYLWCWTVLSCLKILNLSQSQLISIGQPDWNRWSHPSPMRLTDQDQAVNMLQRQMIQSYLMAMNCTSHKHPCLLTTHFSRLFVLHDKHASD